MNNDIDCELIKDLYNYPSLNAFSTVREIAVTDKLVNVILERIFHDTSDYDRIHSLSLKDLLSYSSHKPNRIDSYIESHSELWNMVSQYFGEGFNYEQLNYSGAVTWDCYDFYVMGRALLYAECFSDITEQVLEDIFDTELERYEEELLESNDFEDSKEETISSWLKLAKDCSLAMAEGTTENENLQSFVDDMRRVLFDDKITESCFLKSFDTLLHYIFGCCECTYREIITISSKNIADYLENRHRIPESHNKTMIDDALNAISSPLDEGWFGLPNICCYDKENKNFSVSFFIGDNGRIALNLLHVRPFYILAMRIIDEIVPLVLQEISPSADSADGSLFFAKYLIIPDLLAFF